MATAKGMVKKTPLSEFAASSWHHRRRLDDGDTWSAAQLTDGKHDVMLFSSGGKAVRFRQPDVRPMAATLMVCAEWLDRGQTVISMLVAEDEEQSVLTGLKMATASGRRSSSTPATAAAPRA